MLNYLQMESEALLLARLAMGEGADQNSLDQELVMWTVKARTIIGVSSKKASRPTTLKAEILHPGQYSAIEGLIAVQYPENLGDDGSNIKRMGYPRDADLDQFNMAYMKAQAIASSRLEDMPTVVQGFDSFVAPFEDWERYRKCNFGEWVEGTNRLAEQPAGATIFYDCWPDDNYQLGFPTPTP
jgi:hypothetical protein